MRRKINGVEYIPAAWAEESARDHDKLVRELDVLLNGEAGAAKQALLCDIVAQVRGMVATPYGHYINIRGTIYRCEEGEPGSFALHKF